MRRLSEQLAGLSTRAARLENRMDEAEQETKEQLAIWASAARELARTQQAEFEANAMKAEATVRSAWQSIRQTLTDELNVIRDGLRSAEAARGTQPAETRADMAEEYAAFMVELANLALTEAEAAVITAMEARQDDSSGAAA